MGTIKKNKTTTTNKKTNMKNDVKMPMEAIRVLQEKYLKDYKDLFKFILFNLNGICFYSHLEVFIKNMKDGNGKKLPTSSVGILMNKFQDVGLIEIVRLNNNKYIRLRGSVYQSLLIELKKERYLKTLEKQLKEKEKNGRDEKAEELEIKKFCKTGKIPSKNILRSGVIGEIWAENWIGFDNVKDKNIFNNMYFNDERSIFRFLINVNTLLKKTETNENIKNNQVAKNSGNKYDNLTTQYKLLYARYDFRRKNGFKTDNDGKVINVPIKLNLGFQLSQQDKKFYEDFETLRLKQIYFKDFHISDNKKYIAPEIAILNYSNLSPTRTSENIIKALKVIYETFEKIGYGIFPQITIYSLTDFSQANEDIVFKMLRKEITGKSEVIQESINLLTDKVIESENKKGESIFYTLSEVLEDIITFKNFKCQGKLLSNHTISSI